MVFTSLSRSVTFVVYLRTLIGVLKMILAGVMMMLTMMNMRRRILMGMMMIMIMVTVFSRSITSVTYLWPLANPRVHT